MFPGPCITTTDDDTSVRIAATACYPSYTMWWNGWSPCNVHSEV